MIEKDSTIYRGNYKFSRVSSCLLSRDDLIELYKILEEKVKESLKIEIEELQKPIEISDVDFRKIKENIDKNLKLSIHIFGIHGEQISGNNLSVFNKGNFPDDVRLIVFENFYLLKNKFNYSPKNTLEIKLDFSKTNILDFPDPTKETFNLSGITINGSNDTWVTGVYQKVLDSLKGKRKKRGWLHTKFIYNIALFLIILPATFWTIFRIDKFIRLLSTQVPNVLTIAIYVYIFFLILFIFQILFNYLRWVFPLLEFKREDGSKMSKHRLFFWLIFLTVVGGFVWDFIKYFWKVIS